MKTTVQTSMGSSIARRGWIRPRPGMGMMMMMMMAAVMGLGVAGPAWAHIELLSPPARYTPDMQKADPCGDPLNPPGVDAPAVLVAGQTVTVEFEEFVEHTGYFRIAIDPTGTDDFVSPMDFDDFYNSPQVVLDDIPDRQDGGLHSVDITVPDMPCNPCTLQLIQVMTDDGAFGPGNDDLYFQCADIVIEPAGLTTGGPTTGGDSTGGGEGELDPSEGTMDDGAVFTSSGPPTGTDGEATDPGSDDPADSGCACRARPSPTGSAPWLMMVALAIARRRPRSGGGVAL